jgi:hypothetical protein
MIRKEVLDNGLTLLTESMPHVRSVTIGVWLRRGSRNEPARLNGISHFIEHLVFKGTETRTAREIALSMDSVGGQIDAFTSKEYTCFYAKVLDQHVEEAVDLLADIVQRPLFDAEELERERQVVLEEIRMVEDSPDDLIYDLFAAEFYPRQTLGRPIQTTSGARTGPSTCSSWPPGTCATTSWPGWCAADSSVWSAAAGPTASCGRRGPAGARRPGRRTSWRSCICCWGFRRSARASPSVTRSTC